MPKNGQRPNKETKKPKQDKTKAAPAVSPFAKGQGGPANKAK